MSAEIWTKVLLKMTLQTGFRNILEFFLRWERDVNTKDLTTAEINFETELKKTNSAETLVI